MAQECTPVTQMKGLKRHRWTPALPHEKEMTAGTCQQQTDKCILLHGDGAWTTQVLTHIPAPFSHGAAGTVGNSKFLLQMLRSQLPVHLHLARHKQCSVLPRASTLQHREVTSKVLHPISCLEQDYPQTLDQGGHGLMCRVLATATVGESFGLWSTLPQGQGRMRLRWGFFKASPSVS